MRNLFIIYAVKNGILQGEKDMEASEAKNFEIKKGFSGCAPNIVNVRKGGLLWEC